MKVGHFGYTKSGGFEIAYMTEGHGSPDILLLPTQVYCQELFQEERAHTRFTGSISAIGRIISFDRRGIGPSEHSPGAVPLEEQVADVLAVLNAAGSDRVAVFGWGDGAMLATLFAASHPQRVTHLIFFHGQAKLTEGEGYEWSMSEGERRARLIEPMLSLVGTPGEVRAHMEAIGSMDVREILPQVQARTLVLDRPQATGIDSRHAR